MANLKASLSTTVTISWLEGPYERECEVEVDYTYDGADLRIVKQLYLGSTDSIGDDELDELVWDAVSDLAADAHAEWLADYGDYLHEQAVDRRAA